MAQMKQQIKTPEKELNRDKQSIRCTVQTLVIRMLRELSEDLISIEKKFSIKGRVHLKNPAWVIGEAVPLDPAEYLLP